MKIGLSLSGGGARGIAHLGVLKALDELRVKIHALSGTSSGAIAGALYSFGLSPDDILNIIISTRYFRLIRPAISLTGLLKMEAVEPTFRKYLGDTTFQDLTIPLTVCVTNLRSGKPEYIAEGDITRALMASSALPVVFDPVKIQGDLYVDGGILNNMPVEPLVGRCNKIIAVHTNPAGDNFNATHIKAVLERVFLLSVAASAYTRTRYCDLMLEPPLMKNFGVFDLPKAEEIFNIGYEYTMNCKKEILSLQDTEDKLIDE